MNEIRSVGVLVLGGLASLSSACGSSATVRTHDGRVYEGKLHDGGPGVVAVGQTELAVAEIDDIDHPGNGAAVAGGVLTTYGVINIAVGVPHCDEQGAAFCLGVFLPAAVGVPMLGWGYITWQGSREEAHEYHDGKRRSRVSVLPIVTSPEGRASVGLTMSGEL